MILAGVVSLAILTLSEAAYKDCDHCNKDGPWWPLFKPSQLISSEFPEHNAQAQYRSHEQKRSYEVSSTPQESRESEETVPHLVSVGDLGSIPSDGVDGPLRTYNSDGKHQVQWDHFSNAGQRSTVSFNSLDAMRGVSIESGISQEQGLKQENRKTIQESAKTFDDTGGLDIKPQLKAVEISNEEEVESSSKSQEDNFFNDHSFFQDKQPAGSLETYFPGGFDISKESSVASDEIKDTSNSIEVPNSNWYHGRLRSRGPVATSYSSMTTLFDSPVTPRIKDLLHPELPHSDVSMYVKNQHTPISRSKFFNGRNTSQQFLVHKPSFESHGILHYQKGPPLTPWPLLTHPHPHSRTTLRWQEAPAHSPIKRVIHHESRVSHITPTKKPFSDIAWSNSRKIEYLKRPPPLSKTLYLIRKKPSSNDLKKVGYRRPNNYVYFVQNKRLR